MIDLTRKFIHAWSVAANSGPTISAKMNASHTPGPWEIGMRNGANANMVFARNGVDTAKLEAKYNDSGICEVYGISLHTRLEEAQGNARNAAGLANARLIAASPDLLSALKTCEAELATLTARLSGSYQVNAAAARRLATAAIAKATAQPQPISSQRRVPLCGARWRSRQPVARE